MHLPPPMGRPPDSAHIIPAAVDQSAAPIVIADSLGRISYANPAVAQLLGSRLDRITGRHFSSLIGGTEHNVELERIGARVAGGQNWAGPPLGRRRGGSRFPLE